MATLKSNDDIYFILRPYKVSETGNPTWVLTQLELKKRNKSLISTTFSMTAKDLETIIVHFDNANINKKQKNFNFTTMDNDFTLTVQESEQKGNLNIIFLFGEVYQLQQGYQLVSSLENVHSFTQELRETKKSLGI